MKTHYRGYPLYERDINPENGDIIMGELNPLLYDTRWKRKNRVKQLKHTIRKYKEGTMLPELVHIRYAYKWLQKLKKPTPNAEVICWHTYLAELKTIRDSINRAVEDAAICLGEAIANRERQEQGND